MKIKTSHYPNWKVKTGRNSKNQKLSGMIQREELEKVIRVQSEQLETEKDETEPLKIELRKIFKF